MIRATTGGVLKSYRNNLMNSFISVNKARDTVLSQRIFNSYAEDPAAAAKAFKLRKSRMAVESQFDINSDTYRKFQTGWSCLDSISKMIDTDTGTVTNTLKGMTLELLNDPLGDARATLSEALKQVSEGIVQTLNQKYGDNFIFAGADGHNVPFEVKEVNGVNKLFYRGVDVDAAVPNVLSDAATNAPVTFTDANGATNYVLSDGVKTMTPTEYNDAVAAGETPDTLKDGTGNDVMDANGNYILADSKTITEADYEKAKEDVEKLDYLRNNDKYFVDIGLGFQEDLNGNLIESSGFNASICGLTFIGYGVDADGDPKNIYSLVQKMGEIASQVKDGQNWSTAQYDEFKRLVGKFEDASAEFKVQYTNFDAGTTKLKNNSGLLEDNFYNLQEQYADLEDVDMADAITSFIWAQYCYNAALKVGNNVLSESLMDYLS